MTPTHTLLGWCRWKMRTLRPYPKLRYYLEVYRPGERRDCWAVFYSSTPFVAIRTGDIVNPGLWPGSEAPEKVLRVTRVEHILWDFGRAPAHKVCVYTEEHIPGAASKRDAA